MQTKKEPLDVNEFITKGIIKQLEKGIIPWKHSFTKNGIPQNLITRKFYRGINVWLLSSLNYPSNQFLSLKQLKDIGASPKKNETAHATVFWKWINMEDKESGQTAQIPFLRILNVFNIRQCEGIPEDKLLNKDEKDELIPNLESEAIVETMPLKPELRHKGKLAMYHPCEDYINIPAMKSYDKRENYYSDLFHYIVHSTGHPKRLNRKELLIMEPFVSDAYSVEELVAEMGASYLKFFVGFPMGDSTTNSTYIDGWLAKIKHDKRVVIYAGNLAQKAVDFILNVKFEVPVQAVSAESGVPEDELV
jgi:antirestriction protein ArdC